MNQLFKNKKGVSIQSSIVAVLLFSFVVVFFITLAEDTGSQYNQQLTFENGNLTQQLRNSTLEIKDISEKLANNTRSADATSTDSVVTFVSSGVSSLQIGYSALTTMLVVTNLIAEEIGIPVEFQIIIITLIVISITFAIVVALLRTGGSV